MTMQKRLYLAAAVLLSAAAVPQLAQAVPILNGHEYQLVNAEGGTWTSANAAATSAGWYLATVTSAAENDFIVSNLLQGLGVADRSHYWIGGTDAASEGTFSWVTGEAFGGYTNWWSGEPNNVNNEDFIAFDLRGEAWHWNDAPDNVGDVYGYGRGYILERSQPSQVPEPASLTLLGLGLLAVGFTRRKRG
jgi:hypothetical protein